MPMTVYDMTDAVSLTPTSDQVAALYAQRRLARGPLLARWQEVQQMYDGDVVVPLPELNRNERSSVPNRVREGLKQFSQRIASSIPALWCPPLRAGIQTSEDRAQDRRRAILGWWGHSRMRIVLRQRARYLQGYGVSPVQIRWDVNEGVPRYEERNPLTTFPSLLRGPAEMCPHDCIFETSQSLQWLRDNYGQRIDLLSKKQRDGKPDRDALYTVLEYVDADVCVLMVLGQKQDDYTSPTPDSMAVELERYPNRADRCPVVVPRQISLSRDHGQFDGMFGMYQTEAMLTALGIIATKKGVFGEHWLIATDERTPEIMQVPNVNDGTVGIARNVTGGLQRLGPDAQFQTNITTDRLAAAQNEQAGLTSELQGQAGTNIRTGARASTLLSNVIDFPIQEGQELLCESIQEENRIAIAFAKGYGDGPKSFYVDWQGARGPVTYDPQTTFETDNNVVKFPLSGADQAGMIIGGGQRIGMDTLAKRTFMRNDPMVEDADEEYDMIIGEKLEAALLASIQQQAAAGGIAPKHVARIVALVVSDKMELAEAITTAHDEAQAEQAAQAQAQAPAAQPGLGGPAQASAPPAAPVDLASALASLRRPQQGVTPQEQMASGPAA